MKLSELFWQFQCNSVTELFLSTLGAISKWEEPYIRREINRDFCSAMSRYLLRLLKSAPCWLGRETWLPALLDTPPQGKQYVHTGPRVKNTQGPGRIAQLVRASSRFTKVAGSIPGSGSIQEATNECISKWKKQVNVSLSLPSFLFLLNQLKKKETT